MKKITLLLLLSLLFSNTLTAQSVSFGQSKIQDLSPIHKRVKIDKTIPKLFERLSESGVDVACGVHFTETHLKIELSEYELKRISDNGIPYTVLIDDMTKFYSQRAEKDMPLAQLELQREKQQTLTNKSSSVKSTVIKNIGQHDDCSELTWNTPLNFTIPSTFGGCLTYNGVAAELDKMRALYPNLISVKANASPTNQLTHEGRTVYVVKISDNPDTNETEPQSLTTGMTHSREVSSLMNQIFYMWYLLENYNSDPFIKNLVDNTELYFIPIVNPDGLAWNETIAPSGGGMQRKNLRAGVCNPGGTASTNNTRGVDINRNFGYQYGLVGSSATLCDNTYRGTAAFSEPETQIMRDFIMAKNIKTALNHHAYSNLLPHPVNGKASTPTGRENEFAKFCHDMTQYNRYVYGPAPSILYAASGDASDWMTGGPADAQGSVGSGKNVLAVSPENGAASGEGDFWPSPTLITTIAKRAMRINFINSYYCGKYAKLHDLTQSNITSLTSNLTFGIERLGHTASNFTLTVTPVSSNIVSITSPVVQTGMTILEQRNVTASMVLSSSILANQKIEYKVTLSNGDYTLYEANFVKVYNPTVLFNNNPDVDLLTKWTTTGGTWVNSTSAYSGTSSITDASTVAYANSVNKSIATTNNINLSGAQKVLVQYYAKWDLERNFDLVQIQGSTNGTTWTTLCGNYTKPTSTSATNPHATKSANSNVQNVNGGGGVLYDGDTRGKWVMEEIVIDANNNSFLVGATTAKFRFRIIADNTNATDMYNTIFDGFYFDDFRVIKQISEPPVAICKNATLALGSGGTLTVLASDVNNGSTDDIGITSLSVSPNTFNCTHRNTTQNVTLTVTDADGQTSSCVATVTITDPNPTAGTVSSNQTICTGTQPSNISISGNVGTIQWQSSIDNITFSNITGQTTSTLSGTTIGNLTAIRYYRAVITNGNCSNSVNSGVVTVSVTQNPTNTSVSPNSRITGSGAFTLTVNGTNFINGQSIVRWNGSNRTTTFVSSTQLTASINATDVASTGTANVTVFNTCNSTTTSAQTVTITNNCTAPVPNVASLPTITAQCSATVTPPTATSNCYGQITGTTNSPLTYSAQGTYQIYWTYNDGNGNTSNQFQTVTITDTTAPVVNVTTLPTISGQCTVNITQTPTATDNCMGTINGVTTDPLTYSTQGTYSILWTYTDNRGNQSFQTQSVVVDDTIAPVANVASLPTVTGQCSATVTAPTATDACAGTITGTTASPLTFSAQGTYSITWTYNDGNGNTSTQTQSVVVDDTIAPVANVASLPTVTGQCSATVTAPTATDACAGTITATTASPLTYNAQGTYSITWTYNDGNGNTSTQTQSVVVDDTIAPVANVTSLPTVTGQCSATVTAPTATDTCAGTITGTTASPLTYNTQGTFNITWTYNDGNGNTSTQTQTVIVNNTNPPTPTVSKLPTISGECGATITTIPTALICSGTVNGTTDSPLTYNTQGIYNITWTYNDGNGNTSTQTQTVIVDDTIAPVANVTTLPTVNGQCSATVTAPIAIDNCTGTITGTTNAPLTYNTQGTYNITWTYNDGNGNTSTQTQTVIVDDTIAPVANVTSLPTVTGQCSATVTAPTANDNCAGTITGTTNAPLAFTTQGTYNITWTYNDGNGNTSSQNQTVVVADTIAPVANVTSLPTVTGQCSASVTAPTAVDNCTGTITGTTNAPLTYNTKGTYDITWTYNDGNGNTSTQTQSVIVDDTIAPVANVASLPTVNGQCSASVTAPTATDNCTGTITGTTNAPLTYNTQGTYNITWTYNDGNGNTATQNQTVVVDDTIAPVANVTSLPTVTGQCSATVSAPTANDNCAGTITGTTTSALVYSTQGAYNITWTYNDGNGNISTQTQTVVVINGGNIVTFYQDLDGDSFGNPNIFIQDCAQPEGYVLDSSDCNDNQIQYADVDNDGFGSSTQVACGVTNNTDCNDTNEFENILITFYQDLDGDTFGNQNISTQACTQPVGYVLNNVDCDDTKILFNDADGDGFGSSIQVACGVTNNTDCNDTNEFQNVLITFYQDLDGDGFGNPNVSTDACTQPVGYVLDNTDCNDNELQFIDADNDGFGSTTLVNCGVTNNTDCNDNQLQYLDADNDGFGSTTLVDCGVTNNTDCNDAIFNTNQLVTYFQDFDGDGFGNPNISIQDCNQPQGYVTNNSDCDDTQILFIDGDNDGFGSTILAACGVSNSSDCNDNLITYADNDNDGLGSTLVVACGVSNSNDCDDTNPTINALNTYYQDIDGDGFGNPNVTITSCSVPVGYTLNGNDCNDNNASIHPGAIDICGDGIDNDCNGIIDNVGQPGGCVPVLTGVQSSQCGITLATIDQYVYANAVPGGAQGYRFRVTKMINGQPSTNPNDVQSIDTYLRLFRITQLSSYAFNTTYQVEVSIRRNNVWQPFYGNPCTVTTPIATTSVQASQCGNSITAMNDIIYANAVPFGTGYRFKITNTSTSQSQTVDRTIREFRMSLFTNIDFNTIYNVQVAVRNTDGTYLPYGATCTITTPTMPPTKLVDAQCGAIIGSLTEIIYADPVTNGSGYRFKITNTQGYNFVLERVTRTFSLDMIPGLLIGNPYEVQVSAKINGVFGPYGTACTIITPGTNTRIVVETKEEVTVKSDIIVYAYPNPFSNNFSVKLENASNEIISVAIYDQTGRLLESKKVAATEFEASAFGTNYPAGVFNLSISQGNQVKTIRIVKR